MNRYYEQDEQLYQAVNSLKAGDNNSYYVMYDLSVKYIYRLIYDKVKEYHVTENLVQETYNIIYNQISTLQDPRDFYSWAGSIATDITYRYLQANRAELLSSDSKDGSSEFAYNVATQDMEGFAFAGATEGTDGAIAVGDVALAPPKGFLAKLKGNIGAKIAIGIAAVGLIAIGGVAIYNAVIDKGADKGKKIKLLEMYEYYEGEERFHSITEYKYDKSGREKESRIEYGEVGEEPTVAETVYYPDDTGNKGTAKVYEDGEFLYTMKLKYDKRGNIVSYKYKEDDEKHEEVVEYDKNGIAKSYSWYIDDQLKYEIKYDEIGNEISTEFYDNEGELQDELKYEGEIEYDKNGNAKKAMYYIDDELRYQCEYDKDGDLVVRYDYTKDGKLIRKKVYEYYK